MAAECASAGYVPNRDYTRDDWDEVGDNPEWTEEEFAQARPLPEVMPELIAVVRRRRGAQVLPTRQIVALRVDDDVVAAYRADGPGWRRRMNAALRKAIGL